MTENSHLGRTRLLVKAGFLMMVLMLTSLQFGGGPAQKAAVPTVDNRQAIQYLNGLPLSFVENRGQAEPPMKYQTKLPYGTVCFSVDEISYQITPPPDAEKPRDARTASLQTGEKSKAVNIRAMFVGKSENVKISALDKTEGTASFFIGNDPKKWVNGAPAYQKLIYRELYPHIDLAVDGGGGSLKHSYIVKAGGDVTEIAWKYAGIDELRVNEGGQLEIQANGVSLKEDVPLSYQMIEGRKVVVQTEYVIGEENTVSFEVGEYRQDKELIIDPKLIYSIYVYPSADSEMAKDVVVSQDGNIFVLDRWNDDILVSVTKRGWGDYTWIVIGGTAQDEAYSLGMDTIGNVYVTGRTYSSDFPITSATAADISYNGGSDVFIVEIRASDLTVYYATFLGGSDADCAYAVAARGDWIYVTGETMSSDFNWSYDAYDTDFNGGATDAFVAIVDSSGMSPKIPGSTYLGGTGNECGYGIAVDSNSIYVTGYTDSTDYPAEKDSAVYSVYDSTANGGKDVFVTKLLQWCHGIYFSTYLGGSGDETGYGITIKNPEEKLNDFYVTGETSSSNFPTTAGAFSTSLKYIDAFITKFNYLDDYLAYSTFLGGGSSETGIGIEVDKSGKVYIAGETTSSDFPVTTNTYDSSFNGDPYDAYVAKLNATGSKLLFATYLGGTANDMPSAITIDNYGNAYVVGKTGSSDFPVSPGATTSFGGNWDSFLSIFGLANPEDLLGTWDGSGAYYKNSETGSWELLSAPAYGVAAGDVDLDNTDDLIGVWTSGLWVEYSKAKTWAKLSSNVPSDIASGDMNGDGAEDVVGGWTTGIWYRNSVSKIWVLMSSAPATRVAAGDINGDGADDLIGVWSNGLWIKYSISGSWVKLSSDLPDDIAAGDMNGDGREDVIGTWSSGVWYRNSKTGAWVKMSSNPATRVTCGLIDADYTDDLIGVWPSGPWVKYSSSSAWEKISSSLPRDIDTGLFRGAWEEELMNDPALLGGNTGDPETAPGTIDVSMEGPGGSQFVYREEVNLIPVDQEPNIMKIAGPGDPGFQWTEQDNLIPQEQIGGKADKEKSKTRR